MPVYEPCSGARTTRLQPMVQLASRDDRLLFLLLDQAHTQGRKLPDGAAPALARTAVFAKDRVGWLPLGADASQIGLVLELDHARTADVYRIAPDCIAIWSPGHTQTENELPEGARTRALEQVLQGPTAAAKRVACLQLTRGLSILEHRVDASRLKLSPLHSGAQLLDETTGSCCLPLPNGMYCVLVEPLHIPWSQRALGRVAFIVPARDPRVTGTRGAELAGPEHLPLLTPLHQAQFLVTNAGRRLNLVGRRLHTLSPDIRAHASTVEALDCRNNSIAALPSWLGELRKLKTLNLDNNCLTTVPPEIGALENLVELSLGGNELLALPSTLGKLQRLEILSLSKNRQLESLPRELARLCNLRELDLSSSGIRELPASLIGLGELEVLNLRGSKVRALPPFVAEFGKLTRIHVGKKMFIPAALRDSAVGSAILRY